VIFNYQSSPTFSQYSPLQFEFKLSGPPTSYNLINVAADQIQLSLPTQSLDGTGTWGDFSTPTTDMLDQQFYQYKVVKGDKHWKRALNQSDQAIQDKYAFTPYSATYEIKPSFLYRVTVDTQFYNSNGIKWPDKMGTYRFWLASQKSGTRKELAYYDFVANNAPTNSLGTTTFTATPILLSPDPSVPQQYSALRVKFTGSQILTTDEIWLEFETHNNVERVFADDLGVTQAFPSVFLTPPTAKKGVSLSCFEYSSTVQFLSDAATGQMRCVLYAGDGAVQRRPAVIKISVPNAVLASDSLDFFVLPYSNPSNTAGQLAHITFKVMRPCRGPADQQRCAYYTTYTKFNTATSGTYSYNNYPNPALLYAILQSGTVGLRNTVHKFQIDLTNSIGASFSMAATTTYAFIQYPLQEIVFNDTQRITRCSTQTQLSVCVNLPQFHAVFAQLQTTLTGNPVVLEIPNQNNGWQKRATLPYTIQIWSSAGNMKI